MRSFPELIWKSIWTSIYPLNVYLRKSIWESICNMTVAKILAVGGSCNGNLSFPSNNGNKIDLTIDVLCANVK